MTPRQSRKKVQSTPNTAEATDNDLFAVVGIGASAGGLEAYTQLLSHLPTDTGMAFVLIQHLAPDQKSMLSAILSRATQMPVIEVQDGMSVKPNHVYVIPPNAKMTIERGVLKLVPREPGRKQFMSVDAFFISLAKERGNKAIGVVLSGGDADGSRGLEEIKAAGGITFAQTEETAKVSSMPNTAVATGHVDFILPPQAIAEELAKIATHPYVTRPSPVELAEEQVESQNTFSTIFALLRSATGVDFTYYKQTTLKRRIMRRMALYKLERLEDYVRYLKKNSVEVIALYQDALINVTSFFRDPEAFEALKRQVFPAIAKDKSPGSPIRVWVAGCSTGEEAYSLAICLLEFLAESSRQVPIQIYATDVSEMAIDKARIGIYKHSQVSDVSPERLQRFFVQVEGGYQICKNVREQCVFARQNLISDPPFSRLDLISCRNVLIYLGTPLQKKLLPIFHYGLKPTGFLMLGTSETVGDFTDLFSLIDKKYKIYSRKLTATRLNMDLIATSYALETANFHLRTKEETQSDLDVQKEADRIVLNQFAPVGAIVNGDLEILQFRGQTSAYLEPAPGKASLNLLRMAKESLRLELRTAIHQAKKEEVPICKEEIAIVLLDRLRQVRIDVIPFKVPGVGDSYFLVLFADTPPLLFETETADNLVGGTAGQGSSQLREKLANEQEITQLKQELATTKEHLQSIIEEQQATNQDLRAANEEILSSNEELQSTNEELETAKEEIQAANEELNTINDELHRRNIESNLVNNDLQNLLSSINIPILMLESDLRIRRFTPLAQRIFNLIPTDIGRPLRDINHNLNAPDLEQQILEVINTLSVKEREIEDQEGHWYDLRIRPYRTSDNKIDGAVVILVDIDAIKRSSELLNTSRNYAEAIVETMRGPLIVLNSELRAISANRAFYEMFQVVPSNIEQRLIFDGNSGEWNIPRLRSFLEEILPSTFQLEEFQDFEIEHEFEQIGHRILKLNARRMFQADLQELILLSIEDITERKRLEAELLLLVKQEQSARESAEAANRAKDEFLSTLSHELRNPLNSLLGWSQMLRTGNLDAATMNHALEAIERSAKSQVQLIEDLLDISRITSGKLRLNLNSIELAPTIVATMEILRLSADAKQIQLETRLDRSSQRLLVDPGRLEQIIGNLLSNAIKFTPAGGRIEVILEYVDGQAQIQVKDTGIGISAEFLPHVFERFQQADSFQTRSNRGLGLGLEIVRHLVELHGGTVEAESPGEGQGATFTVRLPLPTNAEKTVPSIALQPVPVPPRATRRTPALKNIRVLVVDDEADNRELVAAILEICGALATKVGSASEALATLQANPKGYDVLLSDISMPEQDGYELIGQVRALGVEAGGQIPAIALTAFAREEDRQAAIAAGFEKHFTKPVEPEKLVEAIVSLIKQKH